MKVYLMLADGFEEVEALTPLDLLRRAGVDVKTVGLKKKTVTGSHGIPVVCDTTTADAPIEEADAVILPGGLPGTTHLDESDFVDRLLARVNEKGGHLAAICAAPSVLGKRGYLKNKKAVCYPGFEPALIGAKVQDTAVVTDGNVTTGRGMGVSFAFGRELLRVFCGEEVAEKIAASTQANYQ